MTSDQITAEDFKELLFKEREAGTPQGTKGIETTTQSKIFYADSVKGNTIRILIDVLEEVGIPCTIYLRKCDSIDGKDESL